MQPGPEHELRGVRGRSRAGRFGPASSRESCHSRSRRSTSAAFRKICAGNEDLGRRGGCRYFHYRRMQTGGQTRAAPSRQHPRSSCGSETHPKTSRSRPWPQPCKRAVRTTGALSATRRRNMSSSKTGPAWRGMITFTSLNKKTWHTSRRSSSCSSRCPTSAAAGGEWPVAVAARLL